MHFVALLLVLLNIVPIGIDALARVSAPQVDQDASTTEQQSKPCSGCDDDGDAACPPACPDCVYSSSGARLVAPSMPGIVLAPALALLPTAALSTSKSFDLTTPPRAPCTSGVFHPPRA